jgi:hypothetical protein
MSGIYSSRSFVCGFRWISFAFSSFWMLMECVAIVKTKFKCPRDEGKMILLKYTVSSQLLRFTYFTCTSTISYSYHTICIKKINFVASSTVNTNHTSESSPHSVWVGPCKHAFRCIASKQNLSTRPIRAKGLCIRMNNGTVKQRVEFYHFPHGREDLRNVVT